MFFILIVIIFVVAIITKLSKAHSGSGYGKEKSKYQYRRKQFFLTHAEHKFFDTLLSIVGNEYHVFAQVHLSTILDNKVVGQNWRASLAHINRKSVDFVLCDKTSISPKLAIELDDKSHERPDRQERDKVVERILEVAGLPLLRIENRGDYDTQELAEKIRHALGPSTQNYSLQNLTN